MATVVWRTLKERDCERVGERVQLQAKVAYPVSALPDGPPRVLAHRCSRGMICNACDRPACQWAGSLPDIDPFASG